MDDVKAWLSKLGLSQYAEAFEHNDVAPSLLPTLTDQDLRELGVHSLGHRKMLLKAIASSIGLSCESSPPHRKCARRHPPPPPLAR